MPSLACADTPASYAGVTPPFCSRRSLQEQQKTIKQRGSQFNGPLVRSTHLLFSGPPTFPPPLFYPSVALLSLRRTCSVPHWPRLSTSASTTLLLSVFTPFPSPHFHINCHIAILDPACDVSPTMGLLQPVFMTGH